MAMLVFTAALSQEKNRQINLVLPGRVDKRPNHRVMIRCVPDIAALVCVGQVREVGVAV